MQRIADLRAWLFLVFLILGFEIWSRVSFGGTFLFNPFNIQSIAVYDVASVGAQAYMAVARELLERDRATSNSTAVAVASLSQEST